MKKFLQKSCAWLVMLVAWFAVSMSAWAQEEQSVDFSISSDETQTNGLVTMVKANNWGAYLAPGSGYISFEIEDAYITRIVFTGAYPWNNGEPMPLQASCGSIAENEYSTTKTWTAGNTTTTSVEFTCSAYYWFFLPNATVYYVALPPAPEFTISDIVPANGTTVPYFESFTINAPSDKTFDTEKGLKRTISVNGSSKNVYDVQFAGDKKSVTFKINKIVENGDYTIVLPKKFVTTEDGKVSSELNLTYTLTYPYFSIDSRSGVTPSGYETIKSLPSFTVSAPNSVTFEKVQNPTTLRLRGEYDNGLGDYAYTDVPATVALVDGKAVFTFTTPYTDKASLYFKVPAGVITDTEGKTSEEFTASFNVDPYEYFTATTSLMSWTACEGPLTEIVLSVPEDVEVATADGDIKVDGNSWMISDTEIDNTNHTVTIYLDDEIEAGQHSIVIPQGYLKVSDFVVSREIELYGVKVLGADDPFPYTAATPSTWSNITNQSLAEAPIVITFARELASVDATKVSIQTSDWTTKTVAEFNVEMPEAITLTTDGKDLKVQFSDEFLASDYFSSNGYLYVKLAVGALTATNGSVNEENQTGIAFNFSVLKCFTMSAAEWCTYSSNDYMVVPEGYTAYYVSGFEGESVVLSKVGDVGKTIYKGNGYIINGPAGNVYYETGNYWDAVSPNGNFLVANYEEPTTYYAANYENTWDVYSDCSMGACKLYQLSYDNNGENLGFYTQTGTNGASIDVPKGKAFLVVPDRYTAAGSIKRFVLEDGTVVTGLTAVEVPMEKDAIYNLQGQRVNATEKGGVYVKNGKKFIVK